jgi:PAS domain S-box-containing protein
MPAKHKRTSPWFCGTSIFVLILLANAFGSTLALDNPRPDVLEVSAAVPREFPPYFGLDDRGRPKGFAIDIMEHIAVMTGLRISYVVEDSWSGVENAIKSGRAAIIPNIGINEARKEWLEFTSPVETFPVSIFIRQHTNDVRELNDLAGRKVAAVMFNAAVDLLKQHQQIELKIFNDPREALHELLAGHVDAVAYPRPVFLKLAREAGLEHRLKVVGKPLIEIKRAIGVAKGHKELLRRVDQAVHDLVGSRDYEKVLSKWFGEPAPFWSAPRVLSVAVGSSLLLFVLMAGWRYFSLIQLNRRLATSITERQQAEELLRRFELLVAHSRDVILLIRRDDGSILEANEAATRAYGYGHDQLRNMTVHQLRAPETLGQLAQDMAEADAHGILLETYHRRSDGSTFPVEVSSRGEVIGDTRALISVIRDITERKRAEEALHATNEQLRALVQSSPEAIIVLDPNGHVKLWNPAAERVFGWREAEVVGEFLPYVPEDKIEEHNVLRRRVLKGELTALEVRRRRKDGSQVDLSISAAPLRNGDGQVVGIMSVNIDITERNLAEEVRRNLEERLQRAEKMEALGTLAGGVAHDLNNVLGVVVGYSELLLDKLDESNSERSHALEILKGGQRAAAIVQDLLTLARRGIPTRKAVNLNHIAIGCQNSLEMAKTLAPHPNIQIQTDLEPDLLNVLGSAVHLEKSFVNLVTNAIEAMPNGGTLTVKTANCYLDRPVSGYEEVREGDYAVLFVSDTGEGIPDSDLRRIFEPFYTKKIMGRRSGTGLGLAVVWGTVKDHLGYINVESKVGKGTTFSLYFPVTRDEIGHEQVSKSVSEYLGNGESILIVDDVKEQRNLASTMLKRLNYCVASVASGEEAVEYLRNQTVDLVVLDMIMDPGMDGFDTYRKILEIHPRQKAIIVSGFSETERVKQTQSLGAGSYVKKPYVLERLGLAVRQELDRVSFRIPLCGDPV